MPTVKPYWLNPPRTRPAVMPATVLQGGRCTLRFRDRGHREVPRAHRPGTRGRADAARHPDARGRRLGRPAPSRPALHLLQRAVPRPVPGPRPGAGVPGRAGLAAGADRLGAVVRLARRPRQPGRRRLHRRLLSHDRVLARRPQRRQARPRRPRPRPRAGGGAAAGRLGADVDRRRLHPLREVRLAAAGDALRQGLAVGPHRRLPLPGHQRHPGAAAGGDGQHRRRLHLLRPGAAGGRRRQVPERPGPGGDGTVSRRRRQDVGRLLQPVRHGLGQRGGQRRRRRRHHDPHDEARRLPARTWPRPSRRCPPTAARSCRR